MLVELGFSYSVVNTSVSADREAAPAAPIIAPAVDELAHPVSQPPPAEHGQAMTPFEPGKQRVVIGEVVQPVEAISLSQKSACTFIPKL